MMLDDKTLTRFARQIIMPGFGEAGQKKIAAAHIAIIGAGGLGAAVIQYLAAAGVHALTIIDDDMVEASNLNRQVIHAEKNIGIKKSESAKGAAHAINPAIKITSHAMRFDDENAENLISDAAIIADCSDNAETRYAAARASHRLKRKLVFGGAVRLEGQIASFNSGNDSASPCFACLFPAMPDNALAPRCSEAGILGATTGIIGSMMALEVLRLALLPGKPFGDSLLGKLLLFDGAAMTTSIIATQKNPACAICGNNDN